MRISFKNDRVLAVVAHPDDAEMLCAGTLARARDDGAAIGICVMCQGDKGLPGRKKIRQLGRVRQREMKAAVKLLGGALLRFGSPDGELADGKDERRRLIELYRQFRPTLVLAHAPEDYHPDHRASSALAEAASWFCASRGHVTSSPPLDSQPVVWWMDTIQGNGFSPDFFIDVSDYVSIKQKMLMCHKSQLQRSSDGDLAPLMNVMCKQSESRGVQSRCSAAEAFRTHHAFKRTSAW